MFGYFLEQCVSVAIYLGFMAIVGKIFLGECFSDEADE